MAGRRKMAGRRSARAAIVHGASRRGAGSSRTAAPARLLVGLLVCAPGLLRAQAGVAQEASVAGRWLFTIEAPDDAGAVQIPFVFEQEGGVVTGRPDLSVLPQLQASEIDDGRLQDGVLTFSLRVGTEEQSVVIEVEATVEGDAMAGEARVAELEQASRFTARRMPPG